jgi:hypothetical protein
MRDAVIQLTEGDIFDTGDDGSLGEETMGVEHNHCMDGGRRTAGGIDGEHRVVGEGIHIIHSASNEP